MRYLRKLTLAGLAALSLATSSGNLSAAPTPPSIPVVGQGHTRTFLVYYRKGQNFPWVFYCSYQNESDAQWAVANLRSCGYGSYYR